MSTSFEKAREILNDTLPSDVDEVKLTELPDGGLHIEVIIHRTSAALSGQGKWAGIAQRLSKEAPLTGMSEEFLDYTRRFRDHFPMKSLPPDHE
jgi:hypothetical protein